MRLWNKRILSVALTLFLASSLFLTGCATDEKKEGQEAEQNQEEQAGFKPLSTTSKKVIAEYTGGKITEGELNRYINVFAFFSPQVAMLLSDPGVKEKENELKSQLAKEYAAQLYMESQIKDDQKYEKQADDTLKQFEEQLKAAPETEGEKPPKTIEEAIKGKGFTKAELRTFLIRDHKINDFYEQQLKGIQADHVKLNHILISVNEGEAQPGQPKRTDAEAKKRADEVKKKLDAGGDFTKLAKEYSDDPGSKDQGGLIEEFADSFVPEFANAAKTLPLGKISDPVKTMFGYHIIKVSERKKENLAKASEQVKRLKREEIFEEIVEKKLNFKSFLPEDKPAEK